MSEKKEVKTIKKSSAKPAKKTVKKASSKAASKKASKKAAKKTVNKSVEKPTSKKKSSAKPKSRKVQGDRRFFLASGEIISDLLTLADAFESMADEVFYHHVNAERNDFSNWVKDVLEEEELAEQLLESQGRDRSQIVTLRCLIR